MPAKESRRRNVWLVPLWFITAPNGTDLKCNHRNYVGSMNSCASFPYAAVLAVPLLSTFFAIASPNEWFLFAVV